MSARGPILGDAVPQPARPPARVPIRQRSADATSIATLPDAEREIVSAARDLAYLASELARVTEQNERRGSALLTARDDCARLREQLHGVQQLTSGLVEQMTLERALADARLRRANEQAAVAIGLAEERATAAMHRAQRLLSEARAAQSAAAAQAAREAEARQAAHEAEWREAESEPTALERRLSAEIEHVRRERAEHEERLRNELDVVRNEKLEVRTRLSLTEHALQERQHELERERKLADEAMRWASSVERELVLAPTPPAQPAPAPAPAGDCAATPPAAEPPIALRRRRGSRVRLRPTG